MKTYKITTANAAFYQIHEVTAATLARAIGLAVEDANRPGLLAEEARNAAACGELDPGAYAFCRCQDEEGTPSGDECEAVVFVDAGGNG
jgi:hypothetical protein